MRRPLRLAIPQPPVAEPAPFGRQRPQQFTIRRVILALPAVTHPDRSTPKSPYARRSDSP